MGTNPAGATRLGYGGMRGSQGAPVASMHQDDLWEAGHDGGGDVIRSLARHRARARRRATHEAADTSRWSLHISWSFKHGRTSRFTDLPIFGHLPMENVFLHSEIDRFDGVRNFADFRIAFFYREKHCSAGSWAGLGRARTRAERIQCAPPRLPGRPGRWCPYEYDP